MHKVGLIEIPNEIATPFYEGGHKRIQLVAKHGQNELKIHAAFNKRHSQFFIIFGKKNQKELEIEKQESFEIRLMEDTSKYGVEMPEELDAVLLSYYDAYQIFESLTDGKKRSIIYIVKRIKVSQTQIDIALLIIENLKRGIRDQRQLLKPF